jgi:hypothetical protein
MSAYDNEEQALADALRAQATEAGLQPASFEAVRGRADTIRRRRAIGNGVALAVAAAIIAPIGWMAIGPSDPVAPPVAENPSQVPTPTEDPDGVEEPGTEHVFTSQVPQGAAPGVAYIQGSTLHRPDGSTLELLEGTYFDLATMGDLTFAVRAGDEGVNQLYVFDGAGNPSEPYQGVNSVVKLADGSAVGWIDGDGEVWTYGATGPFSLGRAKPDSTAVAMVGRGPCDGSKEGSACGLFYNQPGEDGPMNISDAGPIPVKGLIKLADATETSLLAGQTSYADTSSCHEVLNENRQLVFKTCERVPFQFSPNEKYLSANPTSYLDGFARPGLTIMDLEGKDVAWWTSDAAPDGQADSLYYDVWEDEEHVLAVSTGPTGWHVLRLGVDGSIEKVLGPVVTDDPYTMAPYVLEGR